MVEEKKTEEQKAPAKKAEGSKRIPSAKKRNLQSKRKKLRNKQVKSQVRTALRSLKSGQEKKEDAVVMQKKLKEFYSLVDKGTKKGVFKQNKAARIKSHCAKSLKTT